MEGQGGWSCPDHLTGLKGPPRLTQARREDDEAKKQVGSCQAAQMVVDGVQVACLHHDMLPTDNFLASFDWHHRDPTTKAGKLDRVSHHVRRDRCERAAHTRSNCVLLHATCHAYVHHLLRRGVPGEEEDEE